MMNLYRRKPKARPIPLRAGEGWVLIIGGMLAVIPVGIFCYLIKMFLIEKLIMSLTILSVTGGIGAAFGYATLKFSRRITQREQVSKNEVHRAMDYISTSLLTKIQSGNSPVRVEEAAIAQLVIQDFVEQIRGCIDES